MPDRLPDFETLIRALDAAQVRFVIIGGLAMRMQGSAHLTDDLDICYARDVANLRALVAALAPLHPRLRNAPADLPFIWDERTLRNGANFTFETEAADIDLLGHAPGVDTFQTLWDRADEMDLYGVPVRVASVDDLIAMKRAAGRPKDQPHLLELESLRKLKASGT